MKPIKEIIAMVVSALNNCAAGLEFHTAAVKQLGYTDAQIAEIFMVVGLFNHTNALMRGLRLDGAGLGGACILISGSSADGPDTHYDLSGHSPPALRQKTILLRATPGWAVTLGGVAV